VVACKKSNRTSLLHPFIRKPFKGNNIGTPGYSTRSGHCGWWLNIDLENHKDFACSSNWHLSPTYRGQGFLPKNDKIYKVIKTFLGFLKMKIF
jgi:hypothetical protein